ncbi:hypothetical protein ACFX1Q_008217 [Malus domestica]
MGWVQQKTEWVVGFGLGQHTQQQAQRALMRAEESRPNWARVEKVRDTPVMLGVGKPSAWFQATVLGGSWYGEACGFNWKPKSWTET